jgi:hypothetical protein
MSGGDSLECFDAIEQCLKAINLVNTLPVPAYYLFTSIKPYLSSLLIFQVIKA